MMKMVMVMVVVLMVMVIVIGDGDGDGEDVHQKLTVTIDSTRKPQPCQWAQNE